MSTPPRETNIKALLGRSERDLANIESQYAKSLKAKAIDPDLRIDVKNFAGNMRSVLDYLAQEIHARYCGAGRERFYFPILPDALSFKARMSKWFPDLDRVSPDLYQLLESFQPYARSDNTWLFDFNQLNNENKHEDLVEQTRTETQQVRVAGTFGEVTWNRSAVQFGPGVLIGGVPVDPRTQMPVPSPTQTVQVITWVDFKFAGSGRSALQLLRESLEGVKQMEASIRKYI